VTPAKAETDGLDSVGSMTTSESVSPAASLADSPAPSLTMAKPATMLSRVPGPLTAYGVIVTLGGTQGGYFPTAWGPSTVLLLLVLGVWIAGGAVTDAGRRDVLVLGGLALLGAWTALSIAWSVAPANSVQDSQRFLVVVAAVAVMIATSRAVSYPDLVLALVGGMATVAGYGLLTRLLPDRLGTYNPIAGYRLSEPLGYWNGLGILCAIGIVLAIGVVADGRATWRRVVGSVSLVVFAPTLYFTYSRGAWVALALGLAVVLATTARRLDTAGAMLLVAPAPVLAVAAAASSGALTRTELALGEAVDEGRRLLVVLGLLTVLAAVAALVLAWAGRRIELSRTSRRVVGGVAVAGVVAAAALAFAHYGAPWSLAREAVDAFESPPRQFDGDLNDRLFDLSGTGRVDLWRVAAGEAATAPVVGAGAGTFERAWAQSPNWTFIARDAHSLYLEVVAELGVVGLVLLVAVVGVLAAACLGVRRRPSVPAAFAALVAFLAHAGIDWDWEFPVVTVAALYAGCVGVVASRTRAPKALHRPARVTAGVIVVLGIGVAAWGFLGADSLDRAQSALDRGDATTALAESRNAERWTPWSPHPPTVRGEALLRLDREREARIAFARAVSLDPDYWRGWLGLGVASHGDRRESALRRARMLYPRSVEIERTLRLLRRSG
jgi:O-antigen ligase